jgi:hypothetical protein
MVNYSLTTSNNPSWKSTSNSAITTCLALDSNIQRNHHKAVSWAILSILLSSMPMSHRTPWPESASELYRPSDSRLTANLVPTFEDRWCCLASTTDPYGRILGFLHRNRYFFFQVAPQLYSRGWVYPVTYPLLLRKSGSAGNRTRTSGSVARNSDH